LATTNSNFKVKNGLDAGGTITCTGLTITGTLAQSGTSSPITLNGSVGTSGQVLTSAGAGATPTWTTVSGGGSGFTGAGTSITGVQSAAGVALPISTANNTTASGAITISSGTTSSGIGGITSGSVTIATGAGAGSGNASGAILIQTGNGSGSTGPSGSITIDTGTGSGAAAGSILIGTTNSPTITIGRTGSTTTINGSLTLPSQTANTFLASPNSAAGTPSFRVLSYRDIYPAGLPTTFGQVIEYAPVGGGMSWSTSAPLLKGGGTMTGSLVGTTATTSLAPIRLPSGTVPTTSSQEFGMVAADAESLQLATTKTTGAGPGFGIIKAPQILFSHADSAICNSTTPVSSFASGTLSSLEPGKLYKFRIVYYPSFTYGGTSATLNVTFGFSATPVLIKYNFLTWSLVSGTTLTQRGHQTGVGLQPIVPSQGASGLWVCHIDGYIRTHATNASTFTPQIACSASAGGSSYVIGLGSYIEIQKLGTSTQTVISGNWA
jgi:hypothetical protein